jgi:signal transduction histidine kinase
VKRALSGTGVSPRDRLTRKFLLSEQITSGSPALESPGSAGVLELLEQTGREYRRLIASLPTPYVLLADEGFQVRFSNDAFLRFLGIESPSSEKLRFFDLLDPEGRDAVVRVLVENGELRDVELAGRTPGGRAFVIAGSFRYWASEGCAEGGFVDVTALKEAERRLAAADKLETMGRLAAGLAHDFNNTLLVVSGFADLIAAEEGITDAARAGAVQIGMAVATARQMVQQLLSLRSVTSGAAPGTGPKGRILTDPQGRIRIDLNSALRELEPSLRQPLAAPHALILSVEATRPFIDMSFTRIDQVVRNLVLNARDAMPEGGTIRVATKDGDFSRPLHGHAPVVLEVSDTGTGMDRATLDRVFEPFFTTKEEGKGSGLGLSMVHAIVEAAGGSIQVDSEPCRGTMFRVFLPAAAASEKMT